MVNVYYRVTPTHNYYIINVYMVIYVTNIYGYYTRGYSTVHVRLCVHIGLRYLHATELLCRTYVTVWCNHPRKYARVKRFIIMYVLLRIQPVYVLWAMSVT